MDWLRPRGLYYWFGRCWRMRPWFALAFLVLVPTCVVADGQASGTGQEAAAEETGAGIGDPAPVWGNPSIAGDGYLIIHDPIPNVGPSLPYMFGWTGTVLRIPLGTHALCDLVLGWIGSVTTIDDEAAAEAEAVCHSLPAGIVLP